MINQDPMNVQFVVMGEFWLSPAGSSTLDDVQAYVAAQPDMVFIQRDDANNRIQVSKPVGF